MKDIQSNTLSSFPKNIIGKIVGYENDGLKMPAKIIEMGLLPETLFKILYQAPFGGPLYVEFGEEKSRIALRKEEGDFIIVEDLINAGK
ncbi:FeoA family protein [Chryseobacterium sp. 2R14A]|uniref:FeoA family protein n=1 Tax=Chryseobacterium sp. 2R14A TaxID=3380353 RepID=UPI000A98DD91